MRRGLHRLLDALERPDGVAGTQRGCFAAGPGRLRGDAIRLGGRLGTVLGIRFPGFQRQRLSHRIVGTWPQVAPRRLLPDDRPAFLLLEPREQFLHRRRTTQFLQVPHALDLARMGVAQARIQLLERDQRIDTGPRLDIGDGQAQAQHGVLIGQLPRLLSRYVGVDALGVGLVEPAGLSRQQVPFLFRHPAQPHGAHRDVRFLPGLPHKFRQATGSHVTRQVHLKEALLGVHVSLREEQVVVGGGIDVRYGPVVTQHPDLGAWSAQDDLTGVFRQRSSQHHDHSKGRHQDQCNGNSEHGEKHSAESSLFL